MSKRRLTITAGRTLIHRRRRRYSVAIKKQLREAIWYLASGDNVDILRATLANLLEDTKYWEVLADAKGLQQQIDALKGIIRGDKEKKK